MSDRAMIVAGVMSGTSADGINVALVRIGGACGSAQSRKSIPRGNSIRFELLGHAEYPYPAKVRVSQQLEPNTVAAWN